MLSPFFMKTNCDKKNFDSTVYVINSEAFIQ